jgi:uncharacterized protein
MNISKIPIFVIILLLSLPLTTTADTLYRVTVPLVDHSEQLAAVRLAVQQVVVKISGQRADGEKIISKINELNEDKLMDLVQNIAAQALPGNPLAHSLSVEFIPSALEHWLHTHAITPWSGHRPWVLVWLALEQDGELRFAPDAAQTILKHSAAQRGLPLLLPLLDLDDWQNLPAPTLATASEAQVRQASQRYNPDVMVTVVARQAAQGWQSEWRVFSAIHALTWDSSNEDLNILLQDGIERLTDVLAVHYRRDLNAPSSEFEVVIENVTHLNDYARVQDYLEGLDIVTATSLLEADSNRLHFRIHAHGGADGFARVASLGGLFERVDISTVGILVYRLRGF